MLSFASYLAYLSPYLNRDLDFSVIFKPFGIEISSYTIKDLPTGVFVELLLSEIQSHLLDPEQVIECLLDIVDPSQIEVLEGCLTLNLIRFRFLHRT